MNYPKFIKPGDTIGICSPSFGMTIEPYITRYNNFVKKMNEMGFKIVECEHMRTLKKGRSCSAKQRAKEFTEMWLNPEIDMIFSIAGGEFMMEILPFLDFKLLKSVPPKYFQGYSDNTNLTFPLATFCDVASIYGKCPPEFGMEKWHKSLQDSFDFLLGNNKVVKSFKKYEVEHKNKTPGDELKGYNLTEKTCWKSLTKEQDIKFTGRMIGGCLDCLLALCGTKFDNVKEFIEKYKDDGIIWFLEACDLNVLRQQSAMWQLKQAGWFKYAKGFIIGRPKYKEPLFDNTYEDAYLTHLKDLKVPILIDVDFGHTSPDFHIVSGSLGTVTFKDGVGKIKYELK